MNDGTQESVLRHTLTTTGVMVTFAVVCTALLVSTYLTTREPIAASVREAKLELLAQVLPAHLYDNDLLTNSLVLPPGTLGNREAASAYRATLQGRPTAVLLEVTAPDGYAGEILLLVGLREDGELLGVRVLAHKETPGLGDYIDIVRSSWIKNFDGLSLAKLADDKWRVKKDGGSFDYMAGATITPRAVVKAVHAALKYFAQHRAALLGLPETEETS